LGSYEFHFGILRIFIEAASPLHREATTSLQFFENFENFMEAASPLHREATTSLQFFENFENFMEAASPLHSLIIL
jgi:hypothetical protein